jgi:hypothetical protein
MRKGLVWLCFAVCAALIPANAADPCNVEVNQMIPAKVHSLSIKDLFGGAIDNNRYDVIKIRVAGAKLVDQKPGNGRVLSRDQQTLEIKGGALVGVAVSTPGRGTVRVCVAAIRGMMTFTKATQFQAAGGSVKSVLWNIIWSRAKNMATIFWKNVTDVSSDTTTLIVVIAGLVVITVVTVWCWTRARSWSWLMVQRFMTRAAGPAVVQPVKTDDPVLQLQAWAKKLDDIQKRQAVELEMLKGQVASLKAQQPSPTFKHVLPSRAEDGLFWGTSTRPQRALLRDPPPPPPGVAVGSVVEKYAEFLTDPAELMEQFIRQFAVEGVNSGTAVGEYVIEGALRDAPLWAVPLDPSVRTIWFLLPGVDSIRNWRYLSDMNGSLAIERFGSAFDLVPSGSHQFCLITPAHAHMDGYRRVLIVDQKGQLSGVG